MFFEVGDHVSVICKDEEAYTGDIIRISIYANEKCPASGSIIVKERLNSNLDDWTFDKALITCSNIASICKVEDKAEI